MIILDNTFVQYNGMSPLCLRRWFSAKLRLRRSLSGVLVADAKVTAIDMQSVSWLALLRCQSESRHHPSASRDRAFIAPFPGVFGNFRATPFRRRFGCSSTAHYSLIDLRKLSMCINQSSHPEACREASSRARETVAEPRLRPILPRRQALCLRALCASHRRTLRQIGLMEEVPTKEVSTKRLDVVLSLLLAGTERGFS